MREKGYVASVRAVLRQEGPGALRGACVRHVWGGGGTSRRGGGASEGPGRVRVAAIVAGSDNGMGEGCGQCLCALAVSLSSSVGGGGPPGNTSSSDGAGVRTRTDDVGRGLVRCGVMVT